LTGNSEGLKTVLSSRLLHRELRISLRESHSFLSLPADTTMASSQGTSVSGNSFSRSASHDIFLFKCHFLLHILRFLFFFSNNLMTDVANKQQTTALVLSITVTRTRRHTERTKKLTNLMGNLYCAREHSFQFFVQLFYTVKLRSLILNKDPTGCNNMQSDLFYCKVTLHVSGFTAPIIRSNKKCNRSLRYRS